MTSAPSLRGLPLVVGLALAALLVASSHAMEDIFLSTAECQSLKPQANTGNHDKTRFEDRDDDLKHIEVWQAIVLLVCFGAFALFIVLIHRIVRTYIYYDSHLLDTFFDGGGDMNFGMIAAAVVARWTWTANFTWSTLEVKDYGLVGHFWYAAGGVIQLFLFAIVVCEIRIKAPGAKTYLQVIRARYGAVPHIIIMVFAFVANLLIAGMVMTEGTRILTKISESDLDHEVVAIVLAIVIAFFTVVGGVGGSIYVAYFACVLFLAIVLYYVTDVFWDTLDRDGNELGDRREIFKYLDCAKSDNDNEDRSAVTFLSRDGMVQGIVIILSSFSAVFVDQSFWQAGIAAKPVHSVWGFIVGGLVWFAIPFCASYAFGMAYWVIALRDEGDHFIADEDIDEGLLPAIISNRLMGKEGDFLFFTLTMVAVITTAGAEVLAASSIIIYDIYQTYIAPFRPTPIPDNRDVSLRMQRAIKNEEYLEYDRRCVVLKHVVVVSVTCLLIPITLALYAIDVDIPWLFQFLAVLVGSCVIPISLAVTWHRVTSAGLSAGVIGGFMCGVIAWLIYSATHEEENDDGLEDFKVNTGYKYAMIIGMASSLGMGGLITVFISLCCGGCDPDLLEEEEWEKTRKIDNPILPWSIRYAPDIGANLMNKGRPHFYTVRRTFKGPEIAAYIVGVLLAVLAVLVWPALMLIAEVFNWETFRNWTWAVLIWCIVALAFIALVPLIYEIVCTVRQAYYNRLWARTEQKEILDGQSEQPRQDYHSYKGSESDFHSTMGPESAFAEPAGKKERWKTFINLE